MYGKCFIIFSVIATPKVLLGYPASPRVMTEKYASKIKIKAAEAAAVVV